MTTKSETIAIQTHLMASRLWQIGEYEHLPYGLTGARLMMLHTIEQCEPVSTSGIAEAERVASPTISRIVKELEGQGLVKRTPNPKDGRESFLKLTRKGRTARDKAALLASSHLLERLETLTTEDIKAVEHVARLLNRLCTDMPKSDRAQQDSK